MVEYDDDWITFEDVHRITGYSRAHIDRLEWNPKYMRDDAFPARSTYGGRVVWSRRAVVEWRLRRIKRGDHRDAHRKGAKRGLITHQFLK